MSARAIPVCLSLLLIPSAGAEAAVTWPTVDSQWNALMVGSDYYSDPLGPNPTTVDIVGDTTTFPAGYWFHDEEGRNLMFRMRLSETGAKAKVAWQVLLNTDADSYIEWALQLVTSGTPDRVALSEATVGGGTYGDVTLAATDTWSGDLTTYSRWVAVGDGSAFGNKDDTFLDLAIPDAVFRQYTGLAPGDSFSVALSTSTAHTNIVKDLPQDLTSTSTISGWSEPLDTPAVPEPGTWALFALGLLGLVAVRQRSRRLRGTVPAGAPVRTPRS